MRRPSSRHCCTRKPMQRMCFSKYTARPPCHCSLAGGQESKDFGEPLLGSPFFFRRSRFAPCRPTGELKPQDAAHAKPQVAAQDAAQGAHRARSPQRTCDPRSAALSPGLQCREDRLPAGLKEEGGCRRRADQGPGLVRGNPGIGVNALAKAMDSHQTTASNLVKSLLKLEMLAAEQDGPGHRALQLRLLSAGTRVLRRARGPFAGGCPKR